MDKLERDERREEAVERAFLSFLNGRVMAVTPPFAAFLMDDTLLETEDLEESADFAMMVENAHTHLS